MITEHDLQEAIAECQGERHPNANTCIKLAAFLTLKKEMFPDHSADLGRMVVPEPMYSYAPPQLAPVETVDYKSDSEFGRLIEGRDASEVWPIIDELVKAVQLISPRLYNSFMEKLSG